VSTAAERHQRILGLLVGSGSIELDSKRLCEVCAEVTEMSGAGIMLMSGESPGGSLCSSNAVSVLIEELQFSLGEGPSIDAHHQDRPISEPDLVDPRTPRWLAFGPPALEAGVRAVFGFPLQVGSVRFGVLNLYRDRPGPLSDHQHADALVMADIAGLAILMLQANAPPGRLAAELEVGSNFHYVVHQATGMVSAQLGVSVGEALVRLRAYAFASDRHLTDVARDVVNRELRFDPGSDEHARNP
jgi:hypothetical protein